LPHRLSTRLPAPAPDAPSGICRVLIVDDSRVQRKILSASLKRWGFSVLEAGGGEEALEICRAESVDLVLSDWMMPGMSGPDFCRAFRALPLEHYTYFILLTSKSEKNEVALGLDAGADDFLTKPVHPEELRARIAAGERILRMERELKEKNRLVTATLEELKELYESLDRDLMEARKLQQSLVRERHRAFDRGAVSLLLRPSGHVGGDLVGFFQIDQNRIGLFAIDVSGHGVTSALLTARLSGLLSGNSPDQNIALTGADGGSYVARCPAEVADHLNRLMLGDMETEHYFTLLYAIVDLPSGTVNMVQAGHPHPAVQRAGGAVEFLGDGGLPIGLIADASYDQFSTLLAPGDRLFLMSDGIIECTDPSGVELGTAGVARMMERNIDLTGTAYLESITWDLARWADNEDFTDDVSGVLFEYAGSTRPG
jgi:phosphoserine phosphatase RsbU/P